MEYLLIVKQEIYKNDIFTTWILKQLDNMKLLPTLE